MPPLSAKKKAKKPAKLPSQSLEPLPIDPESVIDFLPDSVLDPNYYALPPGSYPVDIQYDARVYQGDGSVPLPLPQPSVNYEGSGFPDASAAFGGLASSLNITNEDLYHVANELYRRMSDPAFAQDDAYWSHLPPHIRNFVREAVPITSANVAAVPNDAAGGQRLIYAMAQKIVSAASQGMGLGGSIPSILPHSNGTPYAPAPLTAELGFNHQPDARDDEYEDEDDFDGDETGYAAPNGDGSAKKKNKKKKKKTALVEAPPAPTPLPAVKQPPRQPVPPQPAAQPTLNQPPPPPVAPAVTQPPPSSRAAGKQPMITAPPPASSTAPARSARAAGKAPAAPPAAHSHHNHTHPPPAKTPAKGKAPAAIPPAKIWTQSSAEDRDNIRSFWLTLSEDERRDLLQIEKDAVLRKMKEQHRHSCGCAVCGRKKVNIEMELDQLYEQYYEELKSYAADQGVAVNGHKQAPPGAGPFPGSVEVDATGTVTKPDHRAPDPHAVQQDEVIGDEISEEYDDEEDFEDEDELDDDEVGSDEADVGDDLEETQPAPQQPARPIRKPPTRATAPRPEGAGDFSNFGTSLTTIKGGILTVADDLLKNDGAKFLEMMEQLAVARSMREEQNIRELQEETDEEDYDEEKEESIPEEERLEEGKRMFQIFAARMFEQRVLQAYREKIAKQREEQLLRELEEEEDSKRAKEEKKAKESQKKKDKKKMQKQRQDEEKAAKDASLAAEQEAVRAKTEEADRERSKKQEEERNRREAVKKAVLEEQQRQAADRRKRQQEEKEREEEAARKKREREDKARKEREAREKEVKEREKREKDEKLAKEKAEKERQAKEKADKERLAQEAREKVERAENDRLAKLAEERAEKIRLDENARKEKEAAEQARILALQQAQRAAMAEKAATEKAAAERLAAEKAALAQKASPVAPIPIRSQATPRNGPTPQSTPPADVTPLKAAASAAIIRPPGAIRTQKTPQPFFSTPVASGSAYPSRMPVPASFAPGFRPTMPVPASLFSPPQTNDPAISPNPPLRPFASESTPPFDLGPRSAPIGMGIPSGKAGRVSVDDSFTPSTSSIGLPGGARNVSAGEIRSHLGDEFRRVSDRPSPIRPLPIGRPTTYLDPGSSSSTNRLGSPAQPDQVFGSAALGGDDEIVQPKPRNLSSSWDLPVGGVAPGAGRWSSASSIWGSNEAPTTSTPWGAPAMPAIGERSMPSGPGATRQSFGGIGGIGSPFVPLPPGGSGATFSNLGLFNPPGHQSHQQPQQSHSHH